MDVTIIRAGNMGRAIGTRLVAGGNDVLVLDNDPKQAKQLAEELRTSAAGGATAAGGAAGEQLRGDVVVLTTTRPSERWPSWSPKAA